MEWIRCICSGKFRRNFVQQTCKLMAQVRPVLHRHSCSNESVRNASKYEYWVQRSGSGAFVAKFSDVTSFSELVRSWHPFGQLCIDFRAVTKRSETPQNMSCRSNGVDQVSSLRQISMQLRLANLGVNFAILASFASTFVQYRNGPKRPKT
jgi:hypothetical protein